MKRKRSPWIPACGFLVSMVLSLLLTFDAAYSASTWTGNTSTDWGDANNWSAGVPTTSVDAVIPTSPAGGRFPTISSGTYGAKKLTIQASAIVTQIGGTLQVGDDWTNLGTFNASSGTVQFIATTGGGNFAGGTNQFFNLIVNSGVDPEFSGDAGGSILIAGDFTNNNSGLTNTTNVTFTINGSGEQSIYSASTAGNETFGHLIISKSGGTASTTSNLEIAGDVTITQGALALGGSLKVTGNWTNNGGSLSGGSNTVTFAGASKTIGGSASTAFPNVTIGAGASYSLDAGTTHSCNNLVFIASATATSLTHTGDASFSVGGNLTINQPTSSGITTAWNINAGTGSVTGTSTIGGTNTTATRIAKVAVTSGTATFSNTVTLTTGTAMAVAQISVSTGTVTFSTALTHNEGTLTFSDVGTMKFNDTYSFASGGSGTPVLTTVSGCNLEFYGALTSSAAALTFNSGSNAIFKATSTVTPTTAITFGNLQIDSGAAVTLEGSIAVAGSWTNNGGSLTGGSNTVTFSGSGKTIGGSGSTAFPNVTIAAEASPSLDLGTTNSCNNLVFAASGTASSLTHTGDASFSVGGTLTINQPTAAVTTAWNINAGTGSVTGTSTIGGTNNTATRIAKVAVTNGSVTFGNTVTLTTGTAVAVAQITVDTGSVTFSSALTMNEATLTMSGAGTINFNGGYSFASGGSGTPVFTTISGSNVTFGANLTVSATGGLTLDAGSNTTFSGSGNITPTTSIALGNVTVNTGVTATAASAPGTFTIPGNLTLAGTGTLAGDEPVLLTGVDATLDGSGTLSAASTVSAAHSVNATANLTISGTMTISGGVTVTNNGAVTASDLGVTGTWLQNASTSVLNYTGASFTPTLTATASGNTVNYNAAGPQAIKQANYHHLQLSGSGTKTFAAGTTGIAGSMSFGGTAAADATTNSTTIDYNGSESQNVGALNYYNLTLSNGGTKTFASGTVGIANTLSVSGGTVDATTNSSTVNYNGGGAQAVTAINYHNLTLSTGGTKTFSSGTIGIANTLTVTGAAADATTNSTTINYNGSGAQSVRAMNYYNLTLSTGGTKTFAAGTTGIANALSVTGATADFTTNSTTIDYNGGGAQNVGGMNYYNLTLSNAGVKYLPSGTTGIANTFTISGGASADARTNSSTVDYNGSGSQTVRLIDYHHLILSNAGTKTFAASTLIYGNMSRGGTAVGDGTTNSTTINYTGSGSQNIGAMNYYNLSLSNAGTKTFASGTTGIANSLSINGSAAADATTNSTTVDYNGGSWQNVEVMNYYNLTLSNAGDKYLMAGTTRIANAFTVNGSANAVLTFTTTTIDYNGSGAQNVRALNYYNLILSNAGTKTFSSGTTGITNTFTMSGTAAADATTNSTTIDYRSSGAQAVLAIHYHHLTLSSGGTKTIAASTSASGNLTTSGGVTASCGGDLTVAGNLAIGSGTTFNGGGGTIDISGNLTASGTSFTSTSGTLRIGGNFSVTAGAFNHASGTILLEDADTTISAASATLNNLTISKAAKKNAVSLGASLTVAGTVTVTQGHLIQDPSYALSAGAIDVGSNGILRNYGTGGLTVGDSVSNAGLIDFNGGNDAACTGTNRIEIRSSVDGAQRAWSSSGGTFQMVDVDVKDQGGTAAITCYGSHSSGGNDANWTINEGCEGAPTRVEMISFTGQETGSGVALEWRTGYEVDNLGFHIYREENGQRTRLNKQLIAGSALRSGSGTVTAGYSYFWVDDSGTGSQGPGVGNQESASSTQPPALSAVSYLLEDIDLNGKRTWHGPITPVFSDGPLPQKTRAVLLSQLNRQQKQKDRSQSRLQVLKNRLRKNQNPELRNHNPEVTHPPPLVFKSAILPPPGNVSVRGLDDGSGTFSGPLPTGLSDRPSPIPTEAQPDLAGNPTIKLFVQKEGWYRVTQPDLVAAGLDPNIHPRFLQLFANGQEQPILVTGKGKGQFGPQSAVEFYGQGVDTPFTDTLVYWLTTGSKSGKRIPLPRLDSRAGTMAPPQSFPFTVEKKEKIYYVSMIRNDGGEKFFGAVIASEPVDQTLQAFHLDPSPPGEAVLEIILQGLANTSHNVEVLLNDVAAGSVVFTGQGQGTLRVPLAQAGLKEGDNLVRLTAKGGETDVTLVDSVRLTYWHTYATDEDYLRFSAMGGRRYVVNGFSSSEIRVMDITFPEQVSEIGGTVRSQGSGYSLEIYVPGTGERTLLAFSDDRVESVAALEANQPTKWWEAENRADMVIVSPQQFQESLTPLKSLRESQGLSVALVDIEDIYDEFSYGMKTPEAVKGFLNRAWSAWQRPPRFVLLVGDASFDPRNYQGYGNFDFVPTKLAETAYLETASDDWLVDFDDDGLPDLAIGRLPVRTVEEAQGVISKIIGYESQSILAEALLVADIDDDAFSFEAAINQVKALLPSGMTVREVFRESLGDDDQVKQEILSGFGRGPLLVNYIGHGSVGVWRGGAFDTDDAKGLTNGYHLPFAIAMTCLNGFFHEASAVESLAEAMLKAPNGGAVAVLASSGLTSPDPQTVMNKALMTYLFNGESLTIGEAVQRAKAATNEQDVRRTWLLFGDPTTRLKY